MANSVCAIMQRNSPANGNLGDIFADSIGPKIVDESVELWAATIVGNLCLQIKIKYLSKSYDYMIKHIIVVRRGISN